MARNKDYRPPASGALFEGANVSPTGASAVREFVCEDCGDRQRDSEQNDVYGCHRCGGRRVPAGQRTKPKGQR